MANILQKYICAVPFYSLEIHEKDRFLCCASWLKKGLPQNTSPKEAWESSEANDIRKSILDGSYRYCDNTKCPHLNQLLNTNTPNSKSNTLYHVNNIPNDIKQRIDSFNKNNLLPPTTIQFSFDRSCNLKCPSCRINLIVENSKGIERVKKTIDEIEKEYGITTKRLYITGTGDPFVSVGFRDFLRNFDSSIWPNLQNIHLHTNATKWDEKMWNSMSSIHKYVKTCDISIDAATKETYETKTRIGGNWNQLIDNLKFISTIPTLKKINVSFVVQQSNYKEMKQFYDLMYSIFENKISIFYNKIDNWGTFDDEEYLKNKIWDESHPEYLDFIKEVNSFILKDKIWHNLQEFINPKKNII
jgi:hypothetical protein